MPSFATRSSPWSSRASSRERARRRRYAPSPRSLTTSTRPNDHHAEWGGNDLDAFERCERTLRAFTSAGEPAAGRFEEYVARLSNETPPPGVTAEAVAAAVGAMRRLWAGAG